MSKGSLLLCSLALVQVCIVVQLCLISSCGQPTASQAAGGKFPCQDPIGTPPRFMSNHGREELDVDGHSSDWIFDEEAPADEGPVAVRECASDGGAVDVEEEEDEEGWLRPEDDGGSGGAKGGGSSSGSGSGGGDVECPECGKFFKNDKSMFGHLRSHPNRGYKGATPPAGNKLKLSPEPETAAVASSSSQSPSRGTHHQPRDRPVTLFELACAVAMFTLPYPENNNQPSRQVPAPPSPAPPPSFCGSETNAVGVIEHGAGSSNVGAAEAHADQHGGSILKIPKKRRNMLKGIRKAHRKKAKLVPLPPPPPPVPKEKSRYICKHCYAKFPTHQALGGHMAGHHRDKKVLTLNDDASSSKSQLGMAAKSQDGGKLLQVKGGGDDDDGWRDICVSLRRGQLSMASNVQRQSGQASGGQTIEMRQQHSGRRSHGLTRATPAPAPNPTQADDRGGRRLLNIDLNAEATAEPE